MQPWLDQRRQMVARQIKARGVRNRRVLDAMGKVPRHRFVPKDLQVEAYGDFPLPIGHGQTISQPYIVAVMTEALELEGTKRVLEIGTGCGYQTAVLAELAAEVYTVECIPELQEAALELIGSLGYTEVHAKVGDGHEGWPEEAPFDAILVTAAPTEVPDALVAQLVLGGSMVIPVGPHCFSQSLLCLRRTSVGLQRKELFSVRFVPLVRS